MDKFKIKFGKKETAPFSQEISFTGSQKNKSTSGKKPALNPQQAAYLKSKAADIRSGAFYSHITSGTSVSPSRDFNRVISKHGIKPASPDDLKCLYTGIVRAGLTSDELDGLFTHIKTKTQGAVPLADLPNHVLYALKIKDYMESDENFYYLHVTPETMYDLVYEVMTGGNALNFGKVMETFCEKLGNGKYGVTDGSGRKPLAEITNIGLYKGVYKAINKDFQNFKATLDNTKDAASVTLGGKTFILDPSIKVNYRNTYSELKIKSEMKDLLGAEFFMDEALEIAGKNPALIDPDSKLAELLKKYSYDFSKPFAKQKLPYKALHDISGAVSAEYGVNNRYKNALCNKIKTDNKMQKEINDVLNIYNALYKKAENILKKDPNYKWDVDYMPSKHFILRLMGRNLVCPVATKNNNLATFESVLKALKITNMLRNGEEETTPENISVAYGLKTKGVGNIVATAYKKAA
ncbi:MAG: hypothetical protein Q4F80_00065 [bacterium]|nr:hypothetical protein [bacterium]